MFRTLSVVSEEGEVDIMDGSTAPPAGPALPILGVYLPDVAVCVAVGSQLLFEGHPVTRLRLFASLTG